MFDIFEQPWTLVGAAVLVLFGMLTFRSILPEKRHWWQLSLPVFIAAAAFGLDFLVETDLEKIKTAIKTCIKAVEEENSNVIEKHISQGYRDSYHNSKADLMRYCRSLLSQPLVEKNKKIGLMFVVNPLRLNITETIIEEKIGDAINYLILLEALLKERIHYGEIRKSDNSE